MAASYDMLIIPATATEILLKSVSGFLAQRGLHVENVQKQEKSGGPLSFTTNSVVFVSPPQGPKKWVCLTSWISELGVDLRSWYLSNPLAQYLSCTATPLIFLWTYNAGLAAGYSIWDNGDQCESQIVGSFEELSERVALSSDSSLLAGLLDNKEFDYRAFMDSHDGDYEIATGKVAARFGLSVHLLDIMDLIDGDGGVAVSDSEYHRVDLQGWMAITFS